jgi:hypothetical protein
MATGDAEEPGVTTDEIGESDTLSNADKKKWSTPRLRIFARTRTEERILANCKTLSQWGG